ncbi:MULTISPECIES: ComEA family DNA-binding protein [unclassified Psychrobacter]|uniref:ComEA family DNA-binding protein n=1 Tax=unclassified Psychrobacter TaxID=196806 RepID=UPI0025B4B931|nr:MULTISPECIES: ComEA family DNA-binding protein [unclassified Psychrobacter]MDN3452558.1 ComEA family DNA-binding protein [Psychrobacter sp. APC 3350]MDN3501657.1 ComEA family DNA-binding protein [Psychrobacter sp. 5A.1]
MNAHPKDSFASVTKTAILGCVLAILILNDANAAPCFDDPQRAYEYLLSQENAKTQAREQYTVNINRASEGELVSLNGIGSSKAQAIILYREMFGNFKTVDELAKVKGIGAKTVEKNRGRLSVQD